MDSMDKAMTILFATLLICLTICFVVETIF